MVPARTVKTLCLLLSLWICVSASPQGKLDKEFESLPKAVNGFLMTSILALIVLIVRAKM
jgi:hypothetical protein